MVSAEKLQEEAAGKRKRRKKEQRKRTVSHTRWQPLPPDHPLPRVLATLRWCRSSSSRRSRRALARCALTLHRQPALPFSLTSPCRRRSSCAAFPSTSSTAAASRSSELALHPLLKIVELVFAPVFFFVVILLRVFIRPTRVGHDPLQRQCALASSALPSSPTTTTSCSSSSAAQRLPALPPAAFARTRRGRPL